MKEIKANTAFQTNSDKIAVEFKTGSNVTLEYSVTGSNWTQWDESINNQNVTIANIPIGLRLRFSEDCIITERT